MKAKLLPIRFPGSGDDAYRAQTAAMQELYGEDADFLPSVELGGALPDADAAVFFRLPAQAYHLVEQIRGIGLPIFVLTSEYGARSMWDWEQTSFLRAEGIDLHAPHDAEMARVMMRAVAMKREIRNAKFLIWRDVPPSGFYWWQQHCTDRLRERLGIEVVYSSYRELCERAAAIDDETARIESKRHIIRKEDVIGSRLLSAYKLYMAMREQIDRIPGVVGVGCNCLNESAYTDTSPCLAWNLLDKEQNLTVVCEADTLSLATEYIADKIIGTGSFSTNIYPFLMGDAAVRHEKIPSLPVVDRPEDCALLVHCGYCGMIPERIAEQWVLRPSILGMLDENAVMVDARIKEGDVSLIKLHSDMDRWLLAPATLEGYVQYPGSDCRNGALIRVRDGYELMRGIYSHHITVMPGKHVPQLKVAGQLLGLVNEVF